MEQLMHLLEVEQVLPLSWLSFLESLEVAVEVPKKVEAGEPVATQAAFLMT
jgi:hypothetical protein